MHVHENSLESYSESSSEFNDLANLKMFSNYFYIQIVYVEAVYHFQIKLIITSKCSMFSSVVLF